MTLSHHRVRVGALLLVLIALLAVSQLAAQTSHLTRGVVYTVNSTVDEDDLTPGDGVCMAANGFCTLRAAITETNFTDLMDEIILPSGVYTLTLTGPVTEDFNVHGDLDIIKSLTIKGAGSGTTFIKSNIVDFTVVDIYRPVNVAEVNISGVTISSDGNKVSTSLVLDAPGVTLNVNDVVLENNFRGFANLRGKATLTNTIIRNNLNSGTANNAGADALRDFMGAGIYNRGTLTIIDSEIRGNEVRLARAGANPEAPSGTNFSGSGAGIYNETIGTITGSTGDLTIVNTLIQDNLAERHGAGLYNKGTGKIYIDGSAFIANLAGRVVIANQATIAWAHGSGGAIYNDANDFVLITNTLIEDNKADSGGGIRNGGKGTMEIRDSTISTNEALNLPDVLPGNPDDFNPVYGGGGIDNTDAKLTIWRSTIRQNNAYGGGGILNYNMGDLTIHESTITQNTAMDNPVRWARGGGIYNSGPSVAGYSTLRLNNVTISGNFANNGGGLTAEGGGIWNKSKLFMTNVTIAENSAGVGGGFYQSTAGTAGTIESANTIMDENFASQLAAECFDSINAINSKGNNLVSDAETCPGFQNVDPSDLPDVPALLGALGDYGGPTFTHSLQEGSPAIDAGSNATCMILDQRGFVRVGICDIGAYEFNSIQATATSTGTITATGTLTATFTPTHTPTLTRTPTPTRTFTPTRTYTPGGPTITPEPPTETNTPTATDTATLTLTASLTYTPGGPTITPEPPTATNTMEPPTPTNTIDPNAIEIVINGGFENPKPDKPKVPESWSGKNLSKDKRACNKGDKIVAHTGSCAFKFKGDSVTNSRLEQVISPTVLDTFGAGDSFSFTLWAKTNKTTTKAKLIVNLKYDNTSLGDKGQGKAVIKLEKGTVGTYTQYTAPTLVLEGTVKSGKVKLSYKGLKGTIFIDDLSLLRSPGGALIALP